MSIKARAIRTLFRAKRITIEGVRQAVWDRIITITEFESITGEDY